MPSPEPLRAVFATALLAGALILYSADVIPQETAAPVASSAPAPTGAPDRGSLFGFDDLMTWLIQPRHVKLYYAGKQKNWELAAAESRDLRSGFARLAESIPKYLNNDVAQAVSVMIAPQMKAVDAAIAAADSKQFAAAYGELTSACNACHVYMEHPYITIEVPSSAGSLDYPDQSFHPRP